MVNWSASDVRRSTRQKRTEYSGTSPNHKASKSGISNINGTTNTANNKKLYFDAYCDKRSMLLRLPAPSAFIICGLNALSTASDRNCTDPNTWVPMPKAEFIIVLENTLFSTTATPCILAYTQSIPYKVQEAKPNNSCCIFLSNALTFGSNVLSLNLCTQYIDKAQKWNSITPVSIAAYITSLLDSNNGKRNTKEHFNTPSRTSTIDKYTIFSFANSNALYGDVTMVSRTEATTNK